MDQLFERFKPACGKSALHVASKKMQKRMDVRMLNGARFDEDGNTVIDVDASNASSEDEEEPDDIEDRPQKKGEQSICNVSFSNSGRSIGVKTHKTSTYATIKKAESMYERTTNHSHTPPQIADFRSQRIKRKLTPRSILRDIHDALSQLWRRSGTWVVPATTLPKSTPKVGFTHKNRPAQPFPPPKKNRGFFASSCVRQYSTVSAPSRRGSSARFNGDI
jgi:hypothetical protein